MGSRSFPSVNSGMEPKPSPRPARLLLLLSGVAWAAVRLGPGAARAPRVLLSSPVLEARAEALGLLLSWSALCYLCLVLSVRLVALLSAGLPPSPARWHSLMRWLAPRALSALLDFLLTVNLFPAKALALGAPLGLGGPRPAVVGEVSALVPPRFAPFFPPASPPVSRQVPLRGAGAEASPSTPRISPSISPSREAPSDSSPPKRFSALRGEGVYVVRRGDCLWTIARDHLRAPDGSDEPSPAAIDAYWRRIYRANRSVIGPDPDLIFPGARLSIPPPGGELG